MEIVVNGTFAIAVGGIEEKMREQLDRAGFTILHPASPKAIGAPRIRLQINALRYKERLADPSRRRTRCDSAMTTW